MIIKNILPIPCYSHHIISLWIKNESTSGLFQYTFLNLIQWLLLLTAQLSNMTAMTAGQGSMLHLQSNMQHSPLGINIINTHSGSVSFNRIARKKTSKRVIGMINKYYCICFTDVSILHDWDALSGIPVPYLSLPVCPPAGVLSYPNRTTGTKLSTNNHVFCCC